MIVRIDIGAMQEVITGFYTMIQRAIRLKEDLLDCYDRIQTNASNPVPPVSMSAIDEAIEWAYRQIPIMERRLSLAILVATANGHVFPDNGEVKPGSHVVSIDMEKDLAAILPDLVAAAKGGNLSDEQWQTLT